MILGNEGRFSFLYSRLECGEVGDVVADPAHGLDQVILIEDGLGGRSVDVLDPVIRLPVLL